MSSCPVPGSVRTFGKFYVGLKLSLALSVVSSGTGGCRAASARSGGDGRGWQGRGREVTLQWHQDVNARCGAGARSSVPHPWCSPSAVTCAQGSAPCLVPFPTPRYAPFPNLCPMLCPRCSAPRPVLCPVSNARSVPGAVPGSRCNPSALPVPSRCCAQCPVPGAVPGAVPWCGAILGSSAVPVQFQGSARFPV